MQTLFTYAQAKPMAVAAAALLAVLALHWVWLVVCAEQRRTWLDGDWSGGTGHGFYDSMLLQSDLIKRLLMYGHGIENKCDIPRGGVYGLPKTGGLGHINVGRDGVMTTSPHSL